MPQFRIDYLTKEGGRGVWDYEHAYPALADVQRTLSETLKYAKSKMPEIKKLVIVEVSERDCA